jgi:LysM repeat protein
VTVVHGDSLERIARRVGTSIDELKNFRSEVSITQLRIGEKLRYRKMKTGRVIVGGASGISSPLPRATTVGRPGLRRQAGFVANLFPRLKR